jgi:hypothetical protein
MILVACATEDVFIQETEMEGSQSHQPILLPNNRKQGDWIIAPKLSFGKLTITGLAPGHSAVSEKGVFEVDTVVVGQSTRFFEKREKNNKAFRGSNFEWKDPAPYLFTDVEYVFKNHWSLVAGGGFDLQSPTETFGARLGLGYFFEGQTLGGRIDVGVHWASIKSKINYLVTFRTVFVDSTQVDFFDATERQVSANIYGSFLLSVKVPDSPLQIFTQIGFTRQTFFSFQAPVSRRDQPNVSLALSSVLLVPGVAMDLSENYRIVAGVRLRYDLTLQPSSHTPLITTMLGCEITL